MTKTIEQEALDLINEVRAEYCHRAITMPQAVVQYGMAITALSRALEAHAASRQEVSDAVEHYLNQWRDHTPSREVFTCQFAHFILPKPVDPLVEVFREVRKHHAKEGEEWAEAVVRRAHDAAAELGYKLKLVEVGDAD